MILVDSSAWIEFLRGTEHPVVDQVERALADEFAICDAVAMEVLAGARNERHLGELRGLFARGVVLPTFASDFDDAAALHRAGRVRGVTIRKMIDCLIAAVAIRSGLAVLHADSDFDAIASVSPLEVRSD